MIKFYSEDCKFQLKNKRLISNWLKGVAKMEGMHIGALNYIFCSDPYLLEINKQYLGHDYFTDIITFDFSDDYKGIYKDNTLCGDIYISVDTVLANAEDYGEGFTREMHRVIVHGLLHLVGYDDKNSRDQAMMREAENKCLEDLEKNRTFL